MTVEDLLKGCTFDSSVLRLCDTILPEFSALNNENSPQGQGIFSFVADEAVYSPGCINMEELIDRINGNPSQTRSEVRDITVSSPIFTSIESESRDDVSRDGSITLADTSLLNYNQGTNGSLVFSSLNTLESTNRSTSTNRRLRWNISSNSHILPEQDFELHTVETVQSRHDISEEIPNVDPQFEGRPSFLPRNAHLNADNRPNNSSNSNIMDTSDDGLFLSNTCEQYVFSDNNPFVLDNVDEMFAEGLRRFAEHDIVNAVLCFESVVRTNPRHVEAWFFLGKAQSQNEKDDQAIKAFHKCIELAPERAEVYNLLAICYANENKILDAVDALTHFLHFYKPSSQSSHAVPTVHNHLERRQLSLITIENIKDLQQKMIEIIDQLPAIDVNLEIALGTAYHLTGDIRQLINCTQKALSVMPNDENLWNRLGASFTNCGESESAIYAYKKALEISPGFIRARYNLALACWSLGATNEAIEHLLVALQIQHQSIDPSAKASTNIWNLLKLLITIHSDDKSLLAACDTEDLDCLCKTFLSAEDNL